MADKDAVSLYKRLTQLFRSGPIVKRKIKNVKAPSASTAMDLFHKSQRHVYSNIINAYGQYDRMSRYSDFCFHPDTLVYTTTGVFTIKELAEKYKPGERFHVYSYDHEKKQIVIGTAHDPRVAREAQSQKLVRVVFDDGGHVSTTPDHKFMLRDGSYVEAKDLAVGQSLMPLYIKDINGKGYDFIYSMNLNTALGGWELLHRFHVEQLVRPLSLCEVIHHINFDRHDNSLANLRIMDQHDHKRYHAQLNNKNKFNKANNAHSKWMFENNPSKRNDVTFEKILAIAASVDFNKKRVMELLDADHNVINRRIRQVGFSDWNDFSARRHEAQFALTHAGIVKETKSPGLEEIVEKASACKTIYELCSVIGCSENAIKRRLQRSEYKTWSGLKEALGTGKKFAYTGAAGYRFDDLLTYQGVCDAYKPGMSEDDIAVALKTSKNKVVGRILNSGFTSFSEWTSQFNNHKVAAIELLDDESIVYNLTVEKYHNVGVGSLNPSSSNGNDRRRLYSMVIVRQSEMEYTPEVASALDIYADETCSQDDKGRSLHIFSENTRIKHVLEELFYDTLNTEFNLRAWTRNLCKHGDMFLFNDISPELGIINVFPMPVNEVEREEGFDPGDPLAFRFRWVTQGNQVLENWQVSHFRLLGNDAFLPYGASVIEPARRVWRQLILIEDAMLVYRVVRSPERRVFYIDVGNIPPEDVPNYLEQARTRLKTNQVVDKTSGRVDLRYNPLCFRGNTLIPLLDGRTISIKDLIAERAAGKQDHETYSLDLERGGVFVPGKVVWAGESGITKQLARITLDDGGVLEVTPDHKMMLRDGNPIKARDLKCGDSLMPNYVKFVDMFGKNDVERRMLYESIYVPAYNRYVYTHRLVAAAKYGIEIFEDGSLKRLGNVVHHQNFNKHDNSSNNLKLMDAVDHSRLHGELGKKNIIAYNTSDEKRRRTSELNIEKNSVAAMQWYNSSSLHKTHDALRSAAMKRMWSDANRRKKTSENMSYKFDATCVQLCADVLKTFEKFVGAQKLCEALKTDARFLEHFSKINEHLARDPKKALNKTSLTGLLKRAGFDDYRAFVAARCPSLLGRTFKNNVKIETDKRITNHKVVSVEIVDIEETVFNVTVDKYHNLSVQCPNKDGTLEGKVQLYQSVDEDYFLPVRGSETGTKIDTLPGGTNVTAIEDVEYIQKKLFAALKIPKAYLGYDEALCLSKDQEIQLVSGQSKTIADLACDHEAGRLNDVYVWSVDDAGDPVPSKIKRAWQTKVVDELFHVTLDNGYVVKCTPNHPFLCRDGVYVRADELKPGQSLVSLNEVSSFGHFANSDHFAAGVPHHVKSVELVKLEAPEPVYDLEIEGTHNFGIVVDDTDASSLIVVHNSSKSTLAQEDIRFSRTISVIQRTIIAELNKLATIHLFAHGFEGEDLLDFDLQLSNPSTVAQQQKIEMYRTKFEVIGSAPEGLFSRDYLRSQVMDMSDDDIRRIEQQKELDKLIDLKLETMKPPQEEGESAEAEQLGAGGMPDIFGGGGGGLPPPEGAPGEEEPTPGDEDVPPEEPEEEASEEDDDEKLLTSVDNNAPKKNVSLAGPDVPVKPSAFVRARYNRSRRRTHGPTKTHMPDFKYMTSHDSESMLNVDDAESLSPPALERKMSLVKDLLIGSSNVGSSSRNRMPAETAATLETLRKRWNKRSMLSESGLSGSGILKEAELLGGDDDDIDNDDGSGSGG